jgi:vacuolar-type H+-ATPase subunit D/Vma8
MHKIEEKKEALFQEMTKAIDDLSEMAKKANKKFHETDRETKAKMAAGILGGAALLAVLVMALKKNKNKHN